MKHYYLALLCMLFSGISFAQAEKLIKPADLVNQAQSIGVEFTKADLLINHTVEDALAEKIQLDLNEFNGFKLRDSAISSFSNLDDKMKDHLSFTLPTNSGTISLDLVRVNPYSEDFVLTTSDGRTVTNYDQGQHYRGVIAGDPNSVAAVSIYDGKIMAMFSDANEGNMILAPTKHDESVYVLYNDLLHKNMPQSECSTPDDGLGSQLELPPSDVGTSLPLSEACVRFFFEVDEDIHDDKGGVTGASNYTTGIYNQVATLYANEQINTVISQINVITNNSPYSGSVSQMRSQFQAKYNTLNGDLGQLLTYKGSGGIAAGFAGICPSNIDASLSVSSIGSSYNTVPTYSFTIMVVAHEFGHTFGSRHTHACVWNGNNTAIDSCSGSTEGSCSLPGNPANGGTIMSYCHLQSVGINFNLGFGPQPGDLIRSRVVNGACLTSCGGGGGPTCSDGVQNGNETGVDCGGPDCPPCNTACTENTVTVSINLDNYPEETSWSITNASGATVASGGTYGSQPDGSNVTVDACLPDGCYDFTINDTYGDGICCGYGNGSYTVTSGGTTLASGGSFGSSETTNFCLGGGGADTEPPTVPTNLSASNVTQTTVDLSWSSSSDNVGVTGYNVYSGGSLIGSTAATSATVTGLTASTSYTYNVSAVDAAGNESGQSNTVSVTTLGSGGGGSQVLHEGYFESGWDGWVDGGSDCYRYNRSNRSYEGTYSIRLRDNSGTASSMTLNNVNTSGFSQVEIDFYFYPNSMESGEDFFVRYNDGSSWTTVATYASGSSFQNGQFYRATITLDASNHNFNSSSDFRIQCDASANADQIYVDQITITGINGALGDGSDKQLIEPVSDPNIGLALIEEVDEELPVAMVLFPNPAKDFLTVQLPGTEMQNFRIINTLGKVVQQGDSDATKVDVSSLLPGFYVIQVSDGERTYVSKFIKE